MQRNAISLLTLSLAVAAMGCGSGKAQPQTGPQPKATEVTGEDVRKHQDEPIERMLQGRVPGLLVSRTGDGSISVQVRGNTSFAERTQTPLYVLDGLPFQPGKGGVLTAVDPYSIESIKLLRGTEAAIYGIEGANGVIIITTKRGAPKP